MSMRKFFLKVWYALDPLYSALIRLQPLVPASQEDIVFRTRLTKFNGKNVLLSDGTEIHKNDILLKIHLYNIKLLYNHSHIKNDLVKGKMMYKKVRNSMPDLADFIKNHPKESEIKGIIGITTINNGFHLLGFESKYPSNKLYAYFKKVFQMPIYLLSGSNISMAEFKNRKTAYLLMSKEQLYKKYAKKMATD